MKDCVLGMYFGFPFVTIKDVSYSFVLNAQPKMSCDKCEDPIPKGDVCLVVNGGLPQYGNDCDVFCHKCAKDNWPRRNR